MSTPSSLSCFIFLYDHHHLATSLSLSLCVVQGRTVLFKVAMAIFHHKASVLERCEEMHEVIECLRDLSDFDTLELLRIASTQFQFLDHVLIEEQSNKYVVAHHRCHSLPLPSPLVHTLALSFFFFFSFFSFFSFTCSRVLVLRCTNLGVSSCTVKVMRRKKEERDSFVRKQREVANRFSLVNEQTNMSVGARIPGEDGPGVAAGRRPSTMEFSEVRGWLTSSAVRVNPRRKALRARGALRKLAGK
jgi:hypothetical protein